MPCGRKAPTRQNAGLIRQVKYIDGVDSGMLCSVGAPQWPLCDECDEQRHSIVGAEEVGRLMASLLCYAQLVSYARGSSVSAMPPAFSRASFKNLGFL